MASSASAERPVTGSTGELDPELLESLGDSLSDTEFPLVHSEGEPTEWHDLPITASEPQSLIPIGDTKASYGPAGARTREVSHFSVVSSSSSSAVAETKKRREVSGELVPRSPSRPGPWSGDPHSLVPRPTRARGTGSSSDSH